MENTSRIADSRNSINNARIRPNLTEFPETTTQVSQVSPFMQQELSGDQGGRACVSIVVIDDHAVVRRGAINWLNGQRGLHVVAEGWTARQAVALTIFHKPDIVVLDVGLKDEGGLCAAYKIARTCPASRVLAFSASKDPVLVRGMLAAGARGYVIKESELSVLMDAIRVVLRGRRFLDPGLADAVITELEALPEASHRARHLLTDRQWQVLECIVWGYSNKEMAAELEIKVSSINAHRIRICEKLGLTNRAELVRYGIAVGVTQGSSNSRMVKHFRQASLPFDTAKSA